MRAISARCLRAAPHVTGRWLRSTPSSCSNDQTQSAALATVDQHRYAAGPQVNSGERWSSRCRFASRPAPPSPGHRSRGSQVASSDNLLPHMPYAPLGLGADEQYSRLSGPIKRPHLHRHGRAGDTTYCVEASNDLLERLQAGITQNIRKAERGCLRAPKFQTRHALLGAFHVSFIVPQ
jgi:hypothetical protein